MKIVVKNLKGSQFEIDIEPSLTVKLVKEKIQEEQKIEAGSQKLVWVGKVMADDKTIEEYKLKEGDFIVVMVAKAKPIKEKKPEVVPAPVPDLSALSGLAAGGGMASATPPQPLAGLNVPNPVAGEEPHPEGGAGGVIPSGEQLESILVEMESMGFPREEWMRALRAAFYNPDRAVDYLLNGIPENQDQQQQQQQQPAPSTGGGMPTAPTGDMGDMGDNPLAFLQNNPMFSQLRERIIREPQFFQTFMNQLAQTQPQLHQAISQNPQQFLQLLLGNNAGGAGAGAGGVGTGGDNDPPGTIRVTQEEKDAIERLSSLGFPKHRAIEAFFACDKNEEWAANYLFDNGGADDQYDHDVVQEESQADAHDEFEQPGGDAFMPADQPSNADEGDNMAVDNPVQEPVLEVVPDVNAAPQDPPAENAPAENPPADNPPANNEGDNNANNDNNEDEDDSCL